MLTASALPMEEQTGAHPLTWCGEPAAGVRTRPTTLTLPPTFTWSRSVAIATAPSLASIVAPMTSWSLLGSPVSGWAHSSLIEAAFSCSALLLLRTATICIAQPVRLSRSAVARSTHPYNASCTLLQANRRLSEDLWEEWRIHRYQVCKDQATAEPPPAGNPARYRHHSRPRRPGMWHFRTQPGTCTIQRNS